MTLRLSRSTPARLPAGLLVAVAYGMAARVAFEAEPLREMLGVMTVGFMLLVPLALGALTVGLAPRARRGSLGYAIFMPWLPATLCMVLVLVFRLEWFICLVMGLPFIWGMGSVGGVLVYALRRARERSNGGEGPTTLAVVALLLAPYGLTPLETRLPPASIYHTVTAETVIAADPATVWANIIRVPLIQPAEQPRVSLTHLLGVPRPLEARLLRPGVGGLRHGLFAGGIRFEEEITEWTPERSIRFALVAHIAPGLSTPMQMLGGPYFDVQAAGYTIEPLADGRTLLRLSSDYRLESRFNGYGRWWVEAMLADFQQMVLHVVQARAEAGSVPPNG